MQLTEQAKLQNKVTVSHAFSLVSLGPDEAKEMFARMAALGMTIATSVPLGKGMMPLQLMRDSGVRVICGADSVIDHWSPFGDCDILRKANQIAQTYRNQSEYGLNRTLAFATDGVSPLDDKGQRQWPKAGDDATFNLVAASCSAEAVARVSARAAVFRKGRIVAGGLEKTA